MATVSLTGKDVVKINGRILNDFADGDIAVLTHPNDNMAVKTGKNGNSIYAYNATGLQCEFVLRILRASSDDKFLNGLLALMNNDPVAFVLMTGEFVKNVGDGRGNVNQDTYIMYGGVFKRQTDGKSNVEGDTEQAVAIYTLAFSNAPRIIS